MERILITYGTRPFAQRVARLLASPERTIFATCEAIPQLMVDSGKYVQIPRGNSPTFSHEMLKCCLDAGAGLLIPLGKGELRPLAEAKQLFAEYGIHILVPEASALNGMVVMENPTSQTPIDIALDGISLLGSGGDTDGELSGILTQENGVSGLCYITD